MKKYFLLLLLFASLLFLGCTEEQEHEGGQWASLSIYNGSGFESYNVLIKNCSTVLEAFEQVAVLQKKEYPGLGVYVECINGVCEDSGKGVYWQYYVGGELAPVAVDKFKICERYSLLPIVFRYEKPNFNYGG